MRARPPSTLREAIRRLSTIKNSVLYDDEENTLWYNSYEYSNYTLPENAINENNNISLRLLRYIDNVTLKNPVLRADYILPYVEINNRKIGVLR